MHIQKKTPLAFLLKPAFVLAIAIIFAVISFGVYYTMISSGKRVMAFAAVACVALIAQFSTYAIAKGRGVSNPELLSFTVALASWGAIFIVVFPPLSVPDEMYHYVAAYQLSDVLMFLGQGGNEHLLMRAEDIEIIANDSFSSTLLTSQSYGEVIRGILDGDIQSEVVDFEFKALPNSLTENPLQDRLAPAIGITIARLLGLNAVVTFYCGRAANLILFVCLVRYAVKTLPMGKPVMMTVSLIPMTLHLAGSYSYDSFTIAMTFLFFSMLLNLVLGKGKISRRQIIATAVVGAILAPCKVVYSLTAFIVLFARQDRFDSKKVSLWAKTLILGITFASLFLFKTADLVPALIHPPSDIPDMKGTESGEFYDLTFALEHPRATALIYWNTVMSNMEHLTRTMIGGSLGWFQGIIAAPYYIVVALYVVLLSSCIPSEKRAPKLPSAVRAACIALPLVCWLAVMTSMFTGWTFNTENSIDGLQGRYFIPVLPMFLMALMPKRMGCSYNMSFWSPFLMCSVNAIYIVHIVGSSLFN